MARGQLRVLGALDRAKTRLRHFTTIIIAGMGFFTAAYDLFSISLVTRLLGRIYYYKDKLRPGVLPVDISTAVTCIALVGTFFGQLFFGWLGDHVGIKKVYHVTLLLMITCSLGSGLSFASTANGAMAARDVMATLCFFRFWLGFGIGGDYPLSATVMSEYAHKRTRGSFIVAVFAMQGFGILAVGLVGLLVSGGFQILYNPHLHNVKNIGLVPPPQADYVWRIILMFGAFPAALTYYWRMKMPDMARNTALGTKTAKQAAVDMAKVLHTEEANLEIHTEESSNLYGLFSKEFLRRHGLHLLGTTTCWFLLDISFYSQILRQNNILTSVRWLPVASRMTAIQELFKISKAQTQIALCSIVPGYWVTVLLIDKIGRFAIQLQGFFFMAVCMFALAIPWNHWKEHRTPFIMLYSLMFFFSNFGPNSTTFVVPAEIFPARFRSTCHGISAAAGKAGAIIGAFGFVYAAESSSLSEDDLGFPPGIGLKFTFVVLGFVSLFGTAFTFLVPEPKGKSLEDVSGENEESAPEIKGPCDPTIAV